MITSNKLNLGEPSQEKKILTKEEKDKLAIKRLKEKLKSKDNYIQQIKDLLDKVAAERDKSTYSDIESSKANG